MGQLGKYPFIRSASSPEWMVPNGDGPEEKVHSSYEGYSKPIYVNPPQPPLTDADKKVGKKRLRWNLVFLVLIWIMVPMPLWMPFAWKSWGAAVILGVDSLFVMMWMIVILLALKNMIVVFRNKNRDFVSGIQDSDMRHLVAMSAYKEPLDVICRSISSIEKQTIVNRVTVVVSLEERTPDVADKCWELRKRFKGSPFEYFLVVVHPYNVPGEIPGKCSNSNFALRQATEFLQERLGEAFDAERIMVTNLDSDSFLDKDYCAALTTIAQKDGANDPSIIYQAPLFYNWGLDAVSTVTRVTALFRTALMLGALIPFNINTMSIFSFSLKLCREGNFVHPGYQMDDIICLIRWMGVCRKRLRIRMIPLLVISGPTSGRTVEDEYVEWARQARRWTIGAAEVFHYFVVKASNIPFAAAFSWGSCFLIYYGILLCVSGLYKITALFSVQLLATHVPTPLWYLGFALIGTQIICFLCIFIIDALAVALLDTKEQVSAIRNAFHFVMSPLVLTGYSLVELYALHEVAVKGKEVCKHGSSRKDSLTTINTIKF